MKFRKFDGHLQGHPHRLDTPGIEVSSGSLGQGLGIACGVAKGSKIDNHPRRVFCIMGDGEQHEGTIWEAAMCAHHFKLANLIGIVDNNKFCIDGACEDVMGIEPLAKKWEAFGWKVIDVDGHDFTKLCGAIDEARAYKKGPCVLIAHTVKGKGVDFMEDVAGWHYGGLDADKTKKALESIDKMYAKK